MTNQATCEFSIREHRQADGIVHVALIGELDLTVVDQLAQRLSRLRRARTPVRLDLSQLTFVDCRGLRALLVAMADARRDGWPLEIDPHVSHAVGRLIELTDASAQLWPPSDRGSTPERALITEALLARTARLLRGQPTPAQLSVADGLLNRTARLLRAQRRRRDAQAGRARRVAARSQTTRIGSRGRPEHARRQA